MKKVVYILSSGIALGLVAATLLFIIEASMHTKEVLHLASALASEEAVLVSGFSDDQHTYLELRAISSGYSTRALVDTGATWTIVSRDTLLRWRADGADVTVDDIESVTTAGGHQILVFVAKFAELTVAGCMLHDVTIYYSDALTEVIGQDILQQMDAVIFPARGAVAFFNCERT